MAETLHDATLDDFPLDLEHIDDSFEHAIARYEIPYRNGAMLENMGEKARTVKFRCYFWDDDADNNQHLTYADHIILLKHLEAKTTLSRLVHPLYGPMDGCVEQMTVRHDDRERCAEIDITFVEQLRGDITPVEYEDVAAAVDKAAVKTIEQATQTSAAKVKAKGLKPNTLLDKLKSIKEQASSLIATAQGYAAQAMAYVNEVNSFVTTGQSMLTDVAQIANTGISIINYATNLPGTIIGSITQCIGRYVALYNTSISAPDRFMSSLSFAVLELENTLGFSAEVRAAGAAWAISSAGGILKADLENQTATRAVEDSPSFSVSGFATRSDTQSDLLTVQELERILALAGEMVNRALEADRSLTALKDGYAALVHHVNVIRLEREKIVTVQVNNPQPLHLICLANGLPYNSAERIMSINRIVRPNFTDGQVDVYVR